MNVASHSPSSPSTVLYHHGVLSLAHCCLAVSTSMFCYMLHYALCHVLSHSSVPLGDLARVAVAF